ncbi:MAG: hypothetical protein WAN46_01275 [Gammaproteobacteria bacterium]|jgi:hypothetical protein
MYHMQSWKNRARRWGWLAVLGILGPFSVGLAAEERTYIETTGDETTHFSWTLEQANSVTVTVREENKLYVNHCDSLGTTFQWSYRGADSDIVASRSGNIIELRGKFRGEEVHTRHEIDSVPWYQTLAYALPRLVEPDETPLVFWTIRPDNLKLIKMQASWEGTERVAVNGKKLQAHRIRIRPDGFLSKLWHADYWFRVPDGLFVRYEGVHGPPGHPKTVIQYQETVQAQQTSLLRLSDLDHQLLRRR